MTTAPYDSSKTISVLNSTLSLAHELDRSLAITSEPSLSLLRPIKKNLSSVARSISKLNHDQILLERECRQSRVSLEEVRRKEDELAEIQVAWRRLCDLLSGRNEVKYIVEDIQQQFPMLFDDAHVVEDAKAPVGSHPYRDDPAHVASASTAHLASENGEIIHSQTQQMRNQDAQLDVLSASIGRQHHLSLQMNEELDSQAALLDDMDTRLDGTQARLQSASRRLDRFTSGLKEHGSTWTIFGLIILLVMLIAIFK